MSMQTLRIEIAAVLLVAAVTWLTPKPAGADEVDLTKAKQDYQQYCKKCHGESGKGDGPGSAMLNPKPRDFSDCANMNKRTDDELTKVVSEGGESIGMSADMQAWGGQLSDKEIHDLVSFVRSFCKK